MFVNAAGKIVYVNAAAVKFFGARTADELLGRSPLEFTTAATRALIEQRLTNLTKIGECAPAIMQEWIRLDGSHIPVESAAAVVPWHGGQAIQVILRDVSERQRAENEKSRLLASERAARSDAERASRMKDEFLATLSHELRTPLNAILGWSQILRADQVGVDDDLYEGLETIERNARIQTKLIEDLLDMSRIISGKLRLDVQRVVPIAFVESAMETVRPAADAKGIRLEQTLDPSAGPISGDPNRLQQVMWNLLTNAIKFTPRGGSVQVVLQRVDSHIEISVSDSGQGIAAEFLPNLFERFHQADASTTRRHGGLGLGLSIVKQLVELHGGTVSASSRGAGEGATFSIRLPLTAVHAHSADGTGQPLSRATAAAIRLDLGLVDLAGLRVLIVDDEKDALSLVQRVLEDCGAKALTAASAARGIDLLRRESPDVLVSDIGMPEKDGFEMIREIRSLPPEQGGRIPAVALTAFARSEDRTRAMIAGYQVHLSKPIEPRELVATVGSLAGRTGKSA
jgi:PAS domain S-box-containing protein